MSRRPFLMIALLASGPSCMGTAESLSWWITHPLEKVRPLDPVPHAPSQSVELYAGRNEFEPFQIVVKAASKDLAGVDIEFSDLRSSKGATLDRKNIAVYREEFVNLDKRSSIEGGEGQWPDPLIPRVDRYAGEHRNAFPFSVVHGQNQPLWVEIFVPTGTPPGKYSGTAQVTAEGTLLFSVPIQLTVWGFTLPSTSSLRSSFGFSGNLALKQHRGRYTTDDDLRAITTLYTRAALEHRITTHGGSMQPPKIRQTGDRMELDWRDYDAEVGPFIEGTAIPKGAPLQGARATSAEVRTPNEFENDEQARMYWSAWTRHFQEKGWSDRLFLYLWDEPPAKVLPELIKRGRVATRVEPKLHSLVTIPFKQQLSDVVQIWVPLVNCLELKPGFPDFCSSTAPLDAYRGQPGGNLWFYQSCASHGCDIVGGEYFAGWPTYMIDYPGPANRVMQWVAWKYRIAGELYYSVNQGYAQSDPWRNIRISGGNGDGNLFYPGRPDRVGGKTDIPIESIRLKLIREGMEDYEYLALLSKAENPQAADQFADRIVRKPYAWETRPAAFLKARQELGESLDRAARTRETM